MATHNNPGKCEVCGEPALLVARVRLHHRKVHGSAVPTDPDPGGIDHPRCGKHCGVSAYTLDEVTYPRRA